MNSVKRSSTEFRFFVIFSIFAVVLTQCSTAPLIYPDEAGYLGWAYKIVYGCGDGFRYLPGYSVLIAPLVAVSGGIKIAYMLIVIANSLLYGAFSAICVRLAKKMRLSSPVLCAAAVSLYPSFLLYANFAMSEVFLTALTALLVYSVCRLLEDLSLKSAWFSVIFLVLYACMTHVRAATVLPALFLTLVFPVFGRGSKKLKVIFVSVCMLGVFAVAAMVLYLFFNSETVNILHMLGQLKNLFTISGAWSFFTTVISQLSYLILSTFGFAAVGIYYAVKAVRDNENRGMAWFSLMLLLFSALISAIFMYHHERPDQIIYGRYNEYVLPFIMLFGISGFLKHGIKPIVGFLALVPLIFTAAMYSGELKNFGGNVTNTWGIYIYKAFLYNFSYTFTAVVFVVVAIAIFLIQKPKISVIALCALFAVNILYTEYDYFYKGAAARQEYPQLAHILNEQESVVWDTFDEEYAMYPWEYYNYSVYNPGLSVKDDAKYILSQKRIPDMILAGKEKYSDVYLYTNDENVAEIDENGEPSAAVTFTANDSGYIAVTYKNLGNPWLCLAAAEDTVGAVRAGMRVYKEGKLIDDVRRDFLDNVYDEAGIIFDFPYENGEYTVIIETVREFRFRGNELSLKAVVSDDGIALEESNVKIPAGFTEFNPSEIKGTEGFYRYYVTPNGAKIPGIYLNGSFLTIETYGEHGELDVEVFGNGKQLEFLGFEDNKYTFAISEPVNTLEIHSSTYRYCDFGPEFLTTESDIKAIDYFVRGMKKIFNVRLDHRDYGVDIKKIYVN